MDAGDLFVECPDHLFVTFDGECRMDSGKIRDLGDLFSARLSCMLPELFIREAECLGIGTLSSECT